MEGRVVEEKEGKELHQERKYKFKILYYSQLVLLTLV